MNRTFHLEAYTAGALLGVALETTWPAEIEGGVMWLWVVAIAVAVAVFACVVGTLWRWR